MLFASSTFPSLELRYVYMNSNNRLDKRTRREKTSFPFCWYSHHMSMKRPTSLPIVYGGKKQQGRKEISFHRRFIDHNQLVSRFVGKDCKKNKKSLLPGKERQLPQKSSRKKVRVTQINPSKRQKAIGKHHHAVELASWIEMLSYHLP